MNEEQESIFPCWCVLEIMGHRRAGGYVREVQVAGAGFLRIDIPAGDGQAPVTQMYPPASVYGITPCSEEAARAVAKSNQPEPVHPWEIREAKALPAGGEADVRGIVPRDDGTYVPAWADDREPPEDEDEDLF